MEEAFQRVVLAFEQLCGLGNDACCGQRRQQNRTQPVSKKQTTSAQQPHQSKERPKPKQVPKSKPKGPKPSTAEERGERRAEERRHGGKKREEPRKSLKSKNFPEEARRLLQLLSAGRRRQVLEEKLAGWQRRALESWMLERKKSGAGETEHGRIRALADGFVERSALPSLETGSAHCEGNADVPGSAPLATDSTE
eukprot:1947723-Amphidinium_carterae.1